MTTISPLMLFRETATIYIKNDTGTLNTLCRQDAELVMVRIRGTYSYHCFLNCVTIVPNPLVPHSSSLIIRSHDAV
jgi:hypothetical protein